jgi:hypothetical protein
MFATSKGKFSNNFAITQAFFLFPLSLSLKRVQAQTGKVHTFFFEDTLLSLSLSLSPICFHKSNFHNKKKH